MNNDCFVRDGWKCRNCGSRNDLHQHHIEYRSHGGSDELDNLVTLCWKCHRAVHDGKLKVELWEACSKFPGSYQIVFFVPKEAKP